MVPTLFCVGVELFTTSLAEVGNKFEAVLPPLGRGIPKSEIFHLNFFQERIT